MMILARSCVAIATAGILLPGLAQAAAAESRPLELSYSCTDKAVAKLRTAFDLSYSAQNSGALESLRQAIKEDPNCVAARYFLGAWGEGPEAKKMIDEASRATAALPEAERVLFEADLIGRAGDGAGWYAKSKKLVELLPNHWEAHFLASMPAAYLKKFDEALAYLKKAAELNPGVPRVWNYLGYTYIELDRIEEAIGAFKKYSELAPKDPNAHDSLADALLATGRLDEALASYRRALEVSEGSFHLAWSGVAVVNCLKKDWKGCREAIEAQSKGEPQVETRASIDGSLAWVDMLEGKPDQAFATLNKLEKKYAPFKHSPAIYLLQTDLALHQLHAGRHADALRTLELAEKADLSTWPQGYQEGSALTRANYRITALARQSKLQDAKKTLLKMEEMAKKYAGDPAVETRLARARAEVSLAGGDAKAAVAQLSACPKSAYYCGWLLSLAQEKAQDKPGSKKTRDAILKRFHRELMYVWVRQQLEGK